MHLDIILCQIHSKMNETKKSKRLIIWNGGSTYQCIHLLNSIFTLFYVLFVQNENRLLWKLGTLPPGLLTFYKLTHPLDKSWHVLGLGYNPTIERSEIDNAAVIHYNGNMKPWLEIAMTKYRPYWTKYINYEHPYIHGCKISQ